MIMSYDAPSVAWTPLPASFEPASFAVVGPIVLIGGGGQYVGSGTPVPPAVLELRIEQGQVVPGVFWKLPAWPPSPQLARTPLESAGPALVSAATVGSTALSVVMIQASADDAGCLGGWLHPLGTLEWDYIGSASSETDIGANEDVGIADGVLAASESESSELFLVERSNSLADVTWPSGVITRTVWRPRHVSLPDDVTSSRPCVSPSGAWVAMRGVETDRMRDCVLVYERSGTGCTLALRLQYPGFRIVEIRITDEWLVVLERLGEGARLRWRRAIDGEDQHMELGPGHTGLDVLGDRALVSQGSRALVIDLARGVLTHNIQRGGGSELRGGKLAPGYAVFVADDQVGAAPLRDDPPRRLRV